MIRRVILPIRLSNSKAPPAIRSALEAAGVEFINGDGPGVRLRKKKR